MWNASFKLTLAGCVVSICCVGFAYVCLYVYCVESFAHIECYSDCSRMGVDIWLNPFATVLYCVCSAVTVECCVLYPCCMGVFGNKFHNVQQQNNNHTQTYCELFHQTIHRHRQSRNTHDKQIHEQSNT